MKNVSIGQNQNVSGFEIQFGLLIWDIFELRDDAIADAAAFSGASNLVSVALRALRLSNHKKAIVTIFCQ